jgi:hypothetical protein
MGPNIRREDVHDRLAVLWGLHCDAVQGIDAAQSDGDLLAAELLNRSGEAFGELALAGRLELLPGGVGACDGSP